MNAYVLHGANDLRYEQVKRPELQPDEVLMEIKAVGICGSDIPRIYETGAHVHPLIPGHEFAGIVLQAGEQAEAIYREHNRKQNHQKDQEHLVGRKMGVFPLIPCRSCGPCQAGHYELCRSYSYLGSRRDGGFAEYAAVPAANLVEVPDCASFEEAAMLEPMAVAVHAMRRAELNKEDTIVICGLGTIGLLLLMFLLEAGFHRILAIGKRPFQKKKATALGLPDAAYCETGGNLEEQWVLQQTGGRGADVFFECTGKKEAFSQAVDTAAPMSRIVLVGNPDSGRNMTKDAYWKILRNQLTITGTWNSSFNHTEEDDWHYVLNRLRQKKVAPAELITHRLPLEKLHQGLHIMRDKSEDAVKIMGVR